MNNELAVGSGWRKSSYSNAERNCVEVAPLSRGMAMRDSKDPYRGTLEFSDEEWTAFINEAADF